MDIPREPKRKHGRYLIVGAVVVGVLAITAALARLEPAAPSVDRATVWVDSVQRGPMVRQVRGPGTLVPEQIRYVTTMTPGRVERVLAQPGLEVEPGTVLMVLSNPDVQLQALETERELTSAEAQLVNLRATLETQRLNQEATVATVRAAHLEAVRQVRAQEELAARNLASTMDLDRTRDNEEEARIRLDVERRRLVVLSESMEAQLAGQRSQVERLKSISAFRREQLEAMQVRAGAGGVLQQLDLQVGQWVIPGSVLAIVVQPGRLKAVLRVPETQAKDLTVGQPAQIDTRNGVVAGRLVRIDPSVQNGTVSVDVALEGPLPAGARPDLSVDGVIEVDRLPDVLFTGRPAYGQAESMVGLFKLTPDGNHAIRVQVRLGKSSVNTIEIVDGLQPGDRVILSDMSTWDSHERVRLK